MFDYLEDLSFPPVLPAEESYSTSIHFLLVGVSEGTRGQGNPLLVGLGTAALAAPSNTPNTDESWETLG